MNATGLSDLMDRLLGSAPANSLASSGRHCATLAGKYPDEQFGAQMIATYFWWSFVRSSILTEVVRRTFGRGQTDAAMVVHADGTRFSLLLTDPTYTGEPVIGWVKTDPAQRFVRFTPGAEAGTDQVEVAPRLISEAVRREFGRRPGIQDTAPARAAGLTTRLVGQAVEEAGRNHHFGMVLMRSPQVNRTSGSTRGVPTPAIGVHSASTRSPHATIGYTGLRNARPFGITALHALDEQGRAFVQGDQVAVLSTDPLTDSCMLRLNRPLSTFCGLRGPLRESLPKLVQKESDGGPDGSHFHGSASPEERVLVNGYTPNIVEPAPPDRVTLFTEPHTDDGDSGAALIDESHRVLGFAVERASFSVDHASASWVWADQVLRRHRLI